MNPILVAAAELQKYCEERHWDFCFIGGLAVQRWGEPRNTHDADLTLITGFGGEEKYVDELLCGFVGRRPDAREFAMKYRVLLLKSANEIPLDIALGAMPFEENSVARSSSWSLPEIGNLRTCCAEDLVVHKVFAGRERDWLDVEGILTVQEKRLNFDQIGRELEPLLALKEDSDSLSKLEILRRRLGL